MSLSIAIIVEPVGSRWYRSQLTKVDFDLLRTGTTASGFPMIAPFPI